MPYFLTVDNVSALPPLLTRLPTHLMGSLPPQYWQLLPRRICTGNFSIVPIPSEPLLPIHFTSHLPQGLVEITITQAEPWMIDLLPQTLRKLKLSKFAKPTGNLEKDIVFFNSETEPTYIFDPLWLNRFPKLNTFQTLQPIRWRNFGDVNVRLRELHLGHIFSIQEAFGVSENLAWASNLEICSGSLNLKLSSSEADLRLGRLLSVQNISILSLVGASSFASSHIQWLPRSLKSFASSSMLVDGSLGQHLRHIPKNIEEVRLNHVSVTDTGSPEVTLADTDYIPSSWIYLVLIWGHSAKTRFNSSDHPFESYTAQLCHRIPFCHIKSR
jgi:hypothetical protein